MTDPRPLDVEATVARMRKAQAAMPEPVVVAPDPERVAEALAARRAETWHTVAPRRFVRAELGDLTDEAPAVVAALREWAAEPAGRNLVVLGPVGVGKTHVALAAARPRHLAGESVVFYPVVELLDDLRPGGPEGALATAMEAGLLVLDDLAAERTTDWTAERLYALVNRRWMEQRPVVATTNLEPAELSEALGERMYSRLVGGAVPVRLSGPDRRRRRG